MFGIVRSVLLYFVMGSYRGAPVIVFTKSGFINRDISSVTSSVWAGSVTFGQRKCCEENKA